MRRWIFTGLTAALLAGAALPPKSWAQDDAPNGDAACARLTGLASAALADPTASVTQAGLRAASAGDAPRPNGPPPDGGRGPGGPPSGPMPSHCEVFGLMQEHAGPNNQT